MAGVYNQTFFDNHPDKANSDGVLYCVVLVNQKTIVLENWYSFWKRLETRYKAWAGFQRV